MASLRSQSHKGYVAKASLPALPPPLGTRGLVGWLRQNLFYNITNSLMTIVIVLLLWLLISSSSGWFVFDAVVQGSSKQECLQIDSGACWAVIGKRIDQFMFGFYPEAERWRPLICFFLLFVAIGPLLCPAFRPAARCSGLVPFIRFWQACYYLEGCLACRRSRQRCLVGLC